MEIIQLLKKDYDKLLNFIQEENNSFPVPLSDRVDLDSYVDKLLNNAVVYGINDMNELCGIICYYKNNFIDKKAYLSYLCIKKEYRGKKAGQKLLDIMTSDCQKDHFKSIILETNKNNKIARNFYEKNGFVLIKEEINSVFYEKNI